jgi:hypothetical protein
VSLLGSVFIVTREFWVLDDVDNFPLLLTLADPSA